MLGRDAVRDAAGLVEIAHLDERAAVRERRGDDRAARHLADLPLRARRDRVDQRGVRRDEDRLRELVVLGLREEIHRDPVGIRARVGDDEDLGDAGDHVDADRAEHAPLRRGDIGVAGTADLVDRRDRRGAVRERRDRLRAADRRRRATTPARCAAASTSGLRTPPGVGTTMTISATPATCAGIAFISTDDGYAALPPGT